MAEYFFDDDPGFGHGVPISIPSDSTALDVILNIGIDSLDEGFHKLFVRVKDSHGEWSQTLFRPFFRQKSFGLPQDIVAVEYYYDTDPGYGSAYQVPFTPAPRIPFLAWQLNTDSLAFGEHQLYVRVKDQNGKWSLNAHDTIFYYIDTLPTASLSGPAGVCIYDTATFEVTLTGSAPYTIVVDNGFTVDTISGIQQSPYLFGIRPQVAGHYTARVLQVSDAYYTGLYTGIPIEYDVHPFPDPAGPISGPQELCSSTGLVSYSIAWVPNTVSYSWTVPAGATIVNSGVGWYNRRPYISVDFHGQPQTGVITVQPWNACGPGTISSIPVVVYENPIVDAGLDQVIDFGDTAYVSATPAGGAPPYSFGWSPAWAFIDHTLQDAAYINNTTRTISVTVTDTNGCSGSDNLVIYVGPQSGATISGQLVYDNTVWSPLSNSHVYLNKDTVVDMDLTDGSGHFSFEEVSTGWYTLTAASDKAWGGVNATDALIILRSFVDSLELSSLRNKAADVNGSSYVNAVDALLCARRYAMIDSTFPAGDWLFEERPFYTIGVGAASYTFKGICYGDVDGSYLPAKHVQPQLTLRQEGVVRASSAGVVEIPVMTEQDILLGAVSLVLKVPAGYRVDGLRMAQENKGELVYNLIGDELRIAWFSIDPLRISTGGPLLYITASYAILPHGTW